MTTKKSSSRILDFLLIFAVVYLGSQFVLGYFFPEQFGKKPTTPVTAIELKVEKSKISVGQHPILTVKNHTGAALVIKDRCPKPPVDVYFSQTGDTFTPLTLADGQHCAEVVSLKPSLAQGEQQKIDLGPWQYSLFGQIGTYQLRLPSDTPVATGSTLAPAQPMVTFSVVEPGAFAKIFQTFIHKPLLNALVAIASVMPGYNLGLAVIILTLIVKTILYIPTQSALKGQKKMQMLQPKMDELKKKYADDPKKMQTETMKLFSDNKVNPFSSCLPLLIQFPILIGLFYVIRDASHLEYSRHMLYAAFQGSTWTFGQYFLGLDLFKPSVFIMPPLLVVMQFFQMKLSFAINDRKKAHGKSVVDVTPKDKKKSDTQSQQDLQQKIMLYGLPLMIGVFAFQFPTAVSLYWGISTLFAIGQQVVVNREYLK